MWWGKTAGMLAAFQGFHTPHGDKKTRQDVQVIYQKLLGSDKAAFSVAYEVFPACFA